MQNHVEPGFQLRLMLLKQQVASTAETLAVMFVLLAQAWSFMILVVVKMHVAVSHMFTPTHVCRLSD